MFEEYRKINENALNQLLSINYSKPNYTFDNFSKKQYLKCIPEDLFTDKPINGFDDNHFKLMRKHFFVKPYWKWIKKLSKRLENKYTVEICAGTGMLTLALESLGIDIKAVDNNKRKLPQITEIIFDDAEHHLQYNKYDVMICCWPEMDNSFYKSCNNFLEKNPEGEIIYCGEWEGGCTANDKFFENYNLVDLDIGYTSCFGLHDNFFLVYKK